MESFTKSAPKGRIIGFYLISLLLLVSINTLFSQGRGKGKNVVSDCSVSFNSTVTELGSSVSGSESCKTFNVTVNYTGTHTYGLSHVVVGTPCGLSYETSNSNNWVMETNFTDPTTNVFGFKVDNISNFGEGDQMESFDIQFTLCAEDLEACGGDCNLNIAYKAGQCIYYETLPVSCLETPEEEEVVPEEEEEDEEEEVVPEEEDEEEEVVVVEEEEEEEEEPIKPEPISCQESYIASITQTGSSIDENSACKTYQMNVNYNGDKTYALSHLTVGLPCGQVSGISVNAWDIDVTSATGFKIDNINDFGGGTEQQSFIVDFTVCHTDVSGCGDCDITVGYKAGQCTYTESLAISCEPPLVPPNKPTAKLIEETVSICEGDLASLFVNLTGEGPWSLTYSDGADESFVTSIDKDTHELTVSKSGTYTLTSVKDHNGLEGTISGIAVVELTEKPNVTLTGGGTICEGDEATINFDLTGEGPWTVTYEVDGVTETFSTENSLYSITTTSASTFSIVSVNDQNCFNDFLVDQTNTETTRDIVSVVVTKAPTGKIASSSNTFCSGEKVSLNFEFTGEGPWDVMYSNGNSNFSFTTDQNIYSVEVDNSGEYSIISLSGNGCIGKMSGSALVSKIPDIEVDISIDDEYCAGEGILLEAVMPNGDGLAIEWISNGDGSFDKTSGQKVTYYPSSTDENLIFRTIVTSSCDTREKISKTSIRKVNAHFSIDPEMEKILTKLPYEFIPADQYGDTYSWIFSDGTEEHSTTATHTFNKSGNYTISLTVISNNCENTETIQIPVFANANLFIPSVFNPESSNPDNRVVKVYGEDIDEREFIFEIYNRWGSVVYKTVSFEEATHIGWNGTHNSEEQENGVFTYVLRGKFNNGDLFEKTGTITLIK